MKFRVWLEEKDHHFWSRFFTGLWDVEAGREGLEKSLDGFDVDRLKNSGEFLGLPPDTQREILDMVERGAGTVGDLVNVAVGRSRDVETPGFSIAVR